VSVGVVAPDPRRAVIAVIIARADAATTLTIAVGDLPIVVQLTAETPEQIVPLPLCGIVVQPGHAVTVTQSGSAAVHLLVERILL
jgi:hypothetical protein